MQETRFNPRGSRIPGGRKWQPAQVFLPGKCHGQRSVAGYKELDRTEHIIFPFLMRLSDAASSSPNSSSLVLPTFVSLIVQNQLPPLELCSDHCEPCHGPHLSSVESTLPLLPPFLGPISTIPGRNSSKICDVGHRCFLVLSQKGLCFSSLQLLLSTVCFKKFVKISLPHHFTALQLLLFFHIEKY